MKAITGSRSPAALVTIIDVRGSVPRHPGTKMLVRRDAAVMGTVGGARGEAAAIAAAKECIQRRQSTLLTVEMQGTEAVGQEMICGGTNRMLIEYVAPHINKRVSARYCPGPASVPCIFDGEAADCRRSCAPFAHGNGRLPRAPRHFRDRSVPAHKRACPGCTEQSRARDEQPGTAIAS